MDLFKKGTLKSQSLNSRFLASNNPQTSQLRPTLPTQPIALVAAEQPAAPPAPSHQSSKLKLTTSRQSSAFRLNRDQASSPSVSDQVQSTSKDVIVDKKAPVWNKGAAAAKPSKSYTDEELKAMHGISLVSRNSNPGERKEGRWDDSDEDDDWGDTIDFGDGTKVVVGQVSKDISSAKEVPLVAPVARTDNVAHQRSTGSPWKRTEPSSNNDQVQLGQTIDTAGTKGLQHSISRQSPLQERRTSTSQQDAAAASLRSPTQEFGYDQRSRSSSFNKDGRMHQSGDARYQYDQNTFDRRWHQPPPQTREIYNSTTGRLEQIDASQQKSVRRFSQNERKPAELLHRPSYESKTKSQNPIDVQQEVQEKSHENGQTIVPSTEDKRLEKTTAAVIPAVAQSIPLDPSSQDFIAMQKKLMADAREQAVQRRKDQEAEENARRERARKKAEELAAVADREKLEKEKAIKEKAEKDRADKLNAQRQREESQRAKLVERPETRSTPQIAKAPSHSKPASVSNALPTARVQLPPTNSATLNNTKDDEIWQKGIKYPSAHPDTASPETISRSDRQTNLGQQEYGSNSRNVWGPIGPKTASGGRNAGHSEPLLGSFNLDGEMKVNDGPSSTLLNSTARTDTRDQSGAGWSAFDGIAKPRQKQKEAREYNVYDAADEALTPERLRTSPPGQAQSSRTSSRFFPSASNVTQAANKAQDENIAELPFTSPAIPPLLDTIGHAHYEIYDQVPSLFLPSTAVPSKLDFTSRRPSQGVLSDRTNNQHTLRQYGRSRDTLDTQTRSVWEVKQLKDGWLPRIRVPQTEKTLDWTRKERPATISDSHISATRQEATERKILTASSALPAIPAWTLPKTLETTSRTSNIAEPLIPPSPSLKLPTESERGSLTASPSKKGRKEPSRFEQERANKLYTTRPALIEEADHMSPIRVKVSEQDATKIPRRFGKRVAETSTPKKVLDVKRQPVNMSDAPGGSGVKRGFINRAKKLPPGLEHTPIILQRDHGNSIDPLTATQGPPGITLPVNLA